ncbi:ADP-heptose--LPS heptosyltransferase 2 [bioreactor metagenome]|uniref:lipopolysaccharide heptosyltransferase II n=1 Tax=bioreactor metagenome TaxID=1076179 RepID=A0A644YRW7_9ZZZZ
MYKNILVINLMYIGDLLFTTPLLHVLRKHFAESHISLLADEKNAWVVKYNPNISELIGIDKKGYHNKLPNYIELIRQIRQRKYDLVINLHPNERASAIAAFSGAKEVIGFSTKGLDLMFSKPLKESKDIHQADAYLEVLKAVGINDLSNNGLEIWTNETAQAKAADVWSNAFSKATVIGINTGGSWPTKRWTKQGFAELADNLLDKGYGVAFFGGPMDKADVAEIVSTMKYRSHKLLKIFTGGTTLLEMAALVKKCAALVSGDSGPMHIAVAQKVPIVAMFGPSDPVRYHPYGQQNAVIQSGEKCLGCGEHTCEHHSCMKNITAEQVYEVLIKRLG